MVARERLSGFEVLAAIFLVVERNSKTNTRRPKDFQEPQAKDQRLGRFRERQRGG